MTCNAVNNQLGGLPGIAGMVRDALRDGLLMTAASEMLAHQFAGCCLAMRAVGPASPPARPPNQTGGALAAHTGDGAGV